MRRRQNRRRGGVASDASATGMKSESIASNPSSTLDANASRRRMSAQQFKLHLHGYEFQNGEELVLNPEYFPELKEIALEKYVVEIFHATELERLREQAMRAASVTSTNHDDYSCAYHHLLLEIQGSSVTPIRGKMQVSVLKDTAAVFQLAPFNDVMLRFIEKSNVELEFIELSLKDQFMSRRDLWYLKQSLVGMALYVGKSIRVHGTRWQVLEVRANNEIVRSGVVSSKTKFAFRSRTSRFMWLVQMGPELWEMANSGKLYLEILLQVVQNVLSKWIKHKVSHSLTFILFSRCYYPEMDTHDNDLAYENIPTSSTQPPSYAMRPPGSCRTHEFGPQNSSESTKECAFPSTGKDVDTFAIGISEEGRHYQDFYKIVAVDNTVTDVQPLLVRLKEEMNEFPHLCGWRSPQTPSTNLSKEFSEEENTTRTKLRRGIPSKARDGNLLEAINIALNIFEKHHIDRHLSRSGQSVVLITAGNGIFNVNKRLAEITEQRMMDHGIGIDMISLSTPPLHKCPLFLFKQGDLSDLTFPGNSVHNGDLGMTEGCTCGGSAFQSCLPRMSTLPRPYRTGSSELTEWISGQDLSVRGGNAGVCGGNGLCKFCTQRMVEQRRRYEVPLWIPLSFVQERMMIEHKCPLDEDITSWCTVCCEHEGRRSARGFEPLPMCRMFRDFETWKSANYQIAVDIQDSLPKPLERLLNRFQDLAVCEPGNPQSSLSKRTWSFGSSASLPDDDYLTRHHESELVRARAPSLVLDDEMILKTNDERGRSFSPRDINKLRFDCERYDNEVFNVLVSRGSGGTSHGQKHPRWNDDETVGVSTSAGRLCLTPPLKNSASFGTPQHGQQSGKKGVFIVSPNLYCAEGSSGSDGREPSSTRWRYHHDSPRVTSPTRLILHESIDDGVDRENTSRPLGGSLPTEYHVEGNSTAFISSPLIPQTIDMTGKDDLFHSRAYIYKQLTSNQRRWAQVRPHDIQNPYRLVQNMLKWKSLCCPALLPLTTDYVPGPKELQAYYTESFYSVTLPERDEQNGATFRDYREFVMEMVAQRFSQDFQLVTIEVTKQQGKSTETHATLFRLTMGHRIHEIVYNEESNQVDVKRYRQRATARSDVDSMEYRYSLWSPVVDTFLFASQEFRKYPLIEYNWNYLDQLICGYYDEMSESIRYKRVLFCVMPPLLCGNESQQESIVRVFMEQCRKFIEFLHSKAENGASFPSINYKTEWSPSMSRSGVSGFKTVGHVNVKMALHASDSPTSQNWVMARVDTELFATQCYHVEVQWLVCRSSLVDEFITGLCRRAKQLNLEFVQVPENGISSNLDLHPLICPIFLPVHDRCEQRIVELALVERFNFCCEALHVIPRRHLNHEEEYTIMQQQEKGNTVRRFHKVAYYRQYVHRSVICFVRMTETGLVWVSNRKMHCPEIHSIYSGICQLVQSVHVAHCSLQQVLEGVIERATSQEHSLVV